MFSVNSIIKLSKKKKKKGHLIFVRNTVYIYLGSIIVLLTITNALNLVRLAFIINDSLFSEVFVCITILFWFWGFFYGE